jgi:hypothetical protein
VLKFGALRPLLGESRVMGVIPPGVSLGGFPNDAAGIQDIVEITPPLTFVGTGYVGPHTYEQDVSSSLSPCSPTPQESRDSLPLSPNCHAHVSQTVHAVQPRLVDSVTMPLSSPGVVYQELSPAPTIVSERGRSDASCHVLAPSTDRFVSAQLGNISSSSKVGHGVKVEASLMQSGMGGLLFSQLVAAQPVLTTPSFHKCKKQARRTSTGSPYSASVAGKRKTGTGKSMADPGSAQKKVKAMAEAGSQPRLPQ